MSNATNEAIDRLAELDRQSGGTGSDYGVSKLLGVGRAAVSKWRNGLGHMDDDVAIRASEILNDDPGALLAQLHAERSKSLTAKKHWNRIAKMLKAEASTSAAA